jgi:HEAT repeat protein
VHAVYNFPEGLDPVLPTLLRMCERDESQEVRAACYGALGFAKLTSAAAPVLTVALRSPERRVRFRAADCLSRIVPRPVEILPAVLPLLEEHFEPQTQLERDKPVTADVAVAATRALGAIAPGTPIACRAEAALRKLLRDTGHPWRAVEAQVALKRIRAVAPAGSTGRVN